MMVLFLSTDKDRTMKAPTKEQIEGALDELLDFTDDRNLKHDGFLVLALEQPGLVKPLRPPLLQVLASAYGWFVEHIDQNDVQSQTVRNSVSEPDLKRAFVEFAETVTRPENLAWRGQ